MVLDLGGSRPDRPGRRSAAGKGGALLYEQVVEYVEKLVSERGLVPGDLLPTYAELAESVGVSLITVRRALDELERAGKVRRHQGLGTFLARPRILSEPAGPAACSARWPRASSRPRPTASTPGSWTSGAGCRPRTSPAPCRSGPTPRYGSCGGSA